VEVAPSDRRPRMDGVIGRVSEPPWQAVRTAAHGPISLMGISHQESAAGVNPQFARFPSR
jgi:hypothetical protein